ncbi:CHAT domain protein [Polystyrenella longa]|uniref:CHAT domain protein n=1 Tax=Polystyrenella longa TaxID=2528007 RepID=A0A518CNI4_9PLAN|nr:CHAT domain-containing protein [Polystyrenella longa]QDU80754.1 CHAT domain protein [Polystyrenella longa]
MGPAFDQWLQSFSSFQSRRWAGAVANPWQELKDLESLTHGLVSEGLDSRAAAACLISVEEAGLLYEERKYDESLALAKLCKPTGLVLGPAAELINSNRELVIGNIFLVRDEDTVTAAEYFKRAIDASGPSTPLIRGNAAFNLGICQNLDSQEEDAIHSFKLAAYSYELAGRDDKISDVLHATGNTYRKLDRTEEGVSSLMQALILYSTSLDDMGTWRVADDLSRAFLTFGLERPEENDQWLEKAGEMSDIAMAAGTQVWQTLCNEEDRLADLSEQMINLATTRCEIAMLEESPNEMLATLAVMKGRIRLVQNSVPHAVLAGRDDEFKEGISEGVPYPHLELVIEAVEQLSEGRTIALLDQFSIHDNELVMAYVIPQKKYFGGYHTCLGDPPDGSMSPRLRGKERGDRIVSTCQSLLENIVSHGQRCSMVLPDDPMKADTNTRKQLEQWNDEFADEFRQLGEVFFPDEILDEFRSLGVEHVILSVDPLFARTPYSSLIGKHGPIIDEPWDLSLVTSSMEIVRIAERQSRQREDSKKIYWFAPDEEVNASRGGNEEITAITNMMSATQIREKEATVQEMVDSLDVGRFCHFRGHGRWTGDVKSSGPVFTNDEVLSSDKYSKSGKFPGFLFTAACLTGFGDAVGTEMQGSLVDYDRAGLYGTILTNWPIHGLAATVFTELFYEKLHNSGNAASAIREASIHCRALMPHTYLWAPFVLIGGWNLSNFVQINGD